MLGMGKDPAKATLEDAKAACARIKKARESGQVRAFTGNDYAADLAAGNIAVAIAWSGDIQGLAADNPDLRWIAPEGGRDALLRQHDDPQDLGPHRRRARLARTGATTRPTRRRSSPAPRTSRRSSGAGEALAKIAPDLAKSPLVNPPDELRARLHVFRALSDAEDQEFNRVFQDAIGA